MVKRKTFDKYWYYFESVQDPDETLGFISKTYRKIFNRKLSVLGEDFCGTFALSCEWVKRHKLNIANGVERDKTPLNYGKKNYFSKLSDKQKSRLHLNIADVLDSNLPKVEAIAAMNFSYFIFKERKLLLQYFINCKKRLKNPGALFLDCFGGTETMEPNEDITRLKGFTYYWDQSSFDPITHFSKFFIHFKRHKERKRHRVFIYDWRMWTVPEIVDALYEAGFKEVQVFWEGTDSKGHGTGSFHRVRKCENSPAWVSYIVGIKP